MRGRWTLIASKKTETSVIQSQELKSENNQQSWKMRPQTPEQRIQRSCAQTSDLQNCKIINVYYLSCYISVNLGCSNGKPIHRMRGKEEPRHKQPSLVDIDELWNSNLAWKNVHVHEPHAGKQFSLVSILFVFSLSRIFHFL